MSNDLFGNEIEEVEEIELEKPKKLSPFDFMGAVSETKKDIVKDDPHVLRDYPAYVVNRGFGYFPDTVLYANEMNQYPDIPVKAQYYYYMNSLRKRQRRSKWFKLEPDADIKTIREVYQVNSDVAKQYLRVLTEENLQTLRELTDIGEVEKKGKKK